MGKRAKPEDILTQAIVALAERFGRYSYRRITELLEADGWSVSAKRVYRTWRREGATSSNETTQTRPALAGGRLLRTAQARSQSPCLVL